MEKLREFESSQKYVFTTQSIQEPGWIGSQQGDGSLFFPTEGKTITFPFPVEVGREKIPANVRITLVDEGSPHFPSIWKIEY